MDVAQEELGTGLPGIADKNSLMMLNKQWITFFVSLL